jgi:hypothetical protein
LASIWDFNLRLLVLSQFYFSAMKNIHRILGVAAAISLTLPACNKMLEPTPYGQQTIDASFTSFGGTLNAVNGMYNPLIAETCTGATMPCCTWTTPAMT